MCQMDLKEREEKTTPLEDLLTKHNLSQLYHKFESEGYKLNDLSSCNENDINEILIDLRINKKYKLELINAIKDYQLSIKTRKKRKSKIPLLSNSVTSESKCVTKCPK